MSVKDSICEGWLIKSPPSRGLWRGRWRRRWFTLYPGEFPQQYFLAYYTDRSRRKLKGTIDLSHCEQVDVGFKFEDKNLPHIFSIKTEQRTYYLAAETEHELSNWTRYVCDVCGLRPTNDDEGIEAISVTEEQHSPSNASHDYQNNIVQLDFRGGTLESPPISPVSTSPYIPISECITGKSPVLLNKGVNNLRKICDPINISNISNSTYEGPTYHNFVAPPMMYEIPRSLIPRASKPLDEPPGKGNVSPLQSPVDSDSVFTDDTWSQNTSFDKGPRTSKFSDSSADMDAFMAQRCGRLSLDSVKMETSPSVPPRPPKPAHINQSSTYLNISNVSSSKTSISGVLEEAKVYPITDDLYDFPRSHQVDVDSLQRTIPRRHCYNNAAPGHCEDGHIFRYDGLGKSSTSFQDCSYDTDATSDVPPSPSSQCSSVLYSNLPSPVLADQLVPPPIVNRGLKPKRKLSDTLSITSNPEPSSPRLAPNVDRNLKPPLTSIPSPDPGLYTNLISTSTKPKVRKIRAAPSPIPPVLRRSFSDLADEQMSGQPCKSPMQEHYFKLEYLDLDHEFGSKTLKVLAMANNPGNISPGEDCVYKKVDFFKTEAFNVTKSQLERERKKLE